MHTITIPRTATALVVALCFGLSAATVAFATGGHDKVGICHRTNSDSNPYVYLEVPADEANGHITGTDKSHNGQGRWKSDGTFRGTAHSAGDEKHDYFAQSKADCQDTGGTPSTTTSSTSTTTAPTTTGTVTTSPPTSSTTTTSSTTSTSSSPTTSSPPVTTSSSTSSTSTGSATTSTTTTSSNTGSPTSSVTQRSASSASSPLTTRSARPEQPAPPQSKRQQLAFTGIGDVLGALVVACVLILLGVWFWQRSRRGGHR